MSVVTLSSASLSNLSLIIYPSFIGGGMHGLLQLWCICTPMTNESHKEKKNKHKLGDEWNTHDDHENVADWRQLQCVFPLIDAGISGIPGIHDVFEHIKATYSEIQIHRNEIYESRVFSISVLCTAQSYNVGKGDLSTLLTKLTVCFLPVAAVW